MIKEKSNKILNSLNKTESEVGGSQHNFPFVYKADENTPDLIDWISVNKKDFEEKLCTYGSILFRGYNVNTVKKFETVSNLFETESLEYAFRSSPRFAVGNNVYTSTSYPKEFSINMHSEASYMPNGHPSYIVFCCINPASERGETPIADNRLVLSNLSEETRMKFVNKGVKYKRNLNKSMGLSWEEVFQTNDKDKVKLECEKTGTNFIWKGDDDLELTWTKKAIWEHPRSKDAVWFNHSFFFNKYTLEKDYGAIENENQLPNDTYFGDGTEISRDEIAEIREAYKKATVEFKWEKGDVLFLDNMLTSHGRNPYEGKRKIIASLF